MLVVALISKPFRTTRIEIFSRNWHYMTVLTREAYGEHLYLLRATAGSVTVCLLQQTLVFSRIICLASLNQVLNNCSVICLSSIYRCESWYGFVFLALKKPLFSTSQNQHQPGGNVFTEKTRTGEIMCPGWKSCWFALHHELFSVSLNSGFVFLSAPGANEGNTDMVNQVPPNYLQRAISDHTLDIQKPKKKLAKQTSKERVNDFQRMKQSESDHDNWA